MKFAIASVIASLLLVETSADLGFSCSRVSSITCENPSLPLVCASNGVTYQNGCEFNKANCDNKGMRILHEGMCSRSEGGRRLRNAQA
ncbi:Kazal-like serine protease inhibitor domain-containing protein [Phytophthora sojae]|uniref:Kazal-like serine protease inhibitor domain-containing protein n=1 Tax=Phytophthora sojae (strain P6497) TaxID=1094619 RepID=G5A906_PHYSP|nr:Kazal-like serine protease inhibitor domain-containing protein [Phytophthora sojae]EGZ08382.1 Kazal-like serine protease inhibitor domain-containing protein [Phytophthora sojae]|eukprot:XP_009536554.1 Kazal-like serine protease inhibitor domain-containing protein [Phytophthora sojae]